MPSRSDHVGKARRNEKFAERISTLNPPYHEWEVIALFYAALHFIDAKLSESSLHPGTHAARDRAVVRFLRPIWRDYRSIKDDSLQARYETLQFSDTDVEACKNALEQIRNFATT